jgi:protein-S-isoprenylcysteine O-methyltransferase Ste14
MARRSSAIMSKSEGPNVIVFPPVIIVVTVALAVGLQWLVPLALLAQIDATCRSLVGGVVLLFGLLPAIAGAITLLRHGTNVLPSRPATALITGGIYRWTRNPMYTGGAPAMIGIAIIFALDWLPLLMIPSWLTLHYGVVTREENYLERKFGDDYRRYRAQVPRYFGIAGMTHTQKPDFK